MNRFWKRIWGVLIVVLSLVVCQCVVVDELLNPGDVVALMTPEEKDATPPVLVILSPMNNDVVGEWVTFSGTVEDPGSGVSNVWVKTGGSSVWKVAVLSGKNWSLNAQLSIAGWNSNYIYAQDKSGNCSVTQLIRLERKAIPSVVVTAPAHGSFTNRTEILFLGTAAVDAPYNIIKVQANFNNGGWTNAVGTTVWANSVVLTEGTNTLFVRAIADNGLTNTSSEYRIYYEKTVYVSPSGSDANSGVRTAPLLTIQNGINSAVSLSFNRIYLARGTYAPSAGLGTSSATYQYSGAYIAASDLTLSGGWDSGYDSQSGYSVLSGDGSFYHIVFINGVDNVTLDKLWLTGGAANGASNPQNQGGGIYVNAGNGCLITNCVISNNSASANSYGGGGMYLNGGNGHTVYAWVGDNSAQYGGGICISNGAGHIINGTIVRNHALTGYGGGIALRKVINNRVISTVVSNSAKYAGGGIFLSQNYSNFIHSTFMYNSAERGGGICVDGDQSLVISGVIRGNSASYSNGGSPQGGGGIFLNVSCAFTTLSNVVIQSNSNYGVYDFNSYSLTVTNVTWGGNSPADTNS